MAKFKVLGNAGVLTSTLKLAEIEAVEKYRPDALVVKGGEDGKEELFRIGTGDEGHISKYGMTFADATRDENGFATLTVAILFDGSNEELKECIADDFGVALAYLTDLETKLPEVIREIETQKSSVLRQIEIG